MTVLEFFQANRHLAYHPHPERNETVALGEITHGSHKKLWWQCDEGHSWQAPVFAVTSGSWPCPYCSGKQAVSGEIDLATLHPDLVAQWDWEKNGDIVPTGLRPGSRKEVWWRCEHGHSWQTRVYSRVKDGCSCPYCSGRHAIPGQTDLATVRPDLMTKWDWERNGEWNPSEIKAGSHRKVWWRCEYGHSYEAPVGAITAGIWGGCPYCSGKRAIPGQTDLATQYPYLADQWDWEKNGKLNPNTITVATHKQVWWKCQHGHSWQAAIYSRTRENRADCPYCAGQKAWAGFNDLATLRPLLAREWYQPLNGELKPEDVTLGSNKKVWWQCNEGHVWKAYIYARTKPNGTGCPVCAGKVKRRRGTAAEVPKPQTQKNIQPRRSANDVAASTNV